MLCMLHARHGGAFSAAINLSKMQRNALKKKHKEEGGGACSVFSDGASIRGCFISTGWASPVKFGKDSLFVNREKLLRFDVCRDMGLAESKCLKDHICMPRFLSVLIVDIVPRAMIADFRCGAPSGDVNGTNSEQPGRDEVLVFSSLSEQSQSSSHEKSKHMTKSCSALQECTVTYVVPFVNSRTNAGLLP